ncbi:FAD-dependent oxidoreductase, partial [Rhodococcus hoagii]|nr:FAD-dependent oxidoreductase [Prescottella equi]
MDRNPPRRLRRLRLRTARRSRRRYMTGMAYGARARALGVRIRQSTNVVRLISDDFGAVRGVRAPTKRDSVRYVVLATGCGVLPRRKRGRPPAHPGQREQLVLVDQGVRPRPVPTFSDLVNLQYIRRETQRSPTGRQQRSLESRDRRSGRHPKRATRTSSRPRSADSTASCPTCRIRDSRRRTRAVT